ncbi:MAG: alpha-hydroxy acid oxidase [Gammaproteobacteria bacterium]|nr:alpha-hydroxy acid oxidase [Gammaproteobacteria bacterium]
MNYDTRFPSVADLKARAKKRMPGFAFEYVDGGIDQEHGKRRNREAWHDMVLTPRYLRDVSRADLSAPVFGHAYSLPLGVPPVGLGNMMWPGAEAALARAAQRANIPYILSTFSTTDLDEIAALAPDVCWFQLYVPKSAEVMKHLLKRVARANYRVLVVTLDIPVGAKRNRELRCGLKLPFSWTPGIVWQCATHPNWSLRTLRHGRPDFVNIAAYREDPNRGLSQFITHFNMHGVTRERLSLIRDLWDGPLVLKGVQYEQDMRDAADLGVDGLIISNHGGRQLDAAPAAAHTLRGVPAEVHQRMTIMADSGIRTGLDVVRAGALGARMAFSGRSFFWGMGAMGRAGADQVVEIFRDEISRTLKQVGCASFTAMDRGWLIASSG